MVTSSTAFPRTEAALRADYGTAPVDAESFERSIGRCDLAACRGMCCATGVVVNDEVASTLTALVERERDALSALGLDVPDVLFTTGENDDGTPFVRTALAPRQWHGVVDGFPDDFPDAVCVFQLAD